MDDKPSPERIQATKCAIQLIREALDLLDAASAPPQITAHLELALGELRAGLRQR